MAYLRDLASKCRNCGKRATKQLISCRNDKMGEYCASCAKRELKKLTENEKHWS